MEGYRSSERITDKNDTIQIEHFGYRPYVLGKGGNRPCFTVTA